MYLQQRINPNNLEKIEYFWINGSAPRDFNLGDAQMETGLLRWVGAGNLFIHREPRWKVRKSRQVQIEIAVASCVSGPHTFGGGHSAVTTAAAAFVVTTFVSSQGLSRGECFVAYGALVGPTSAVGRRSRGDAGGGGLVFAGAR